MGQKKPILDRIQNPQKEITQPDLSVDRAPDSNKKQRIISIDLD